MTDFITDKARRPLDTPVGSMAPPAALAPTSPIGRPKSAPVGSGTPATTLPTPAPAGTTPTPSGTTPAGPATPYQLPYADYLAAVTQNFQASGTPMMPGGYIDEATWARMSPAEQYQNMLMSAPAVPDPQGGPGNTMPQGALAAPPDVASQFTAQFGAPPWQSSGGTDNIVYSIGPPTNYGQDISQWAIDPSRVMVLPDGRYVYESSNVSGQFLAQAQATDDRTSNQFMATGAAIIGAGALGGELFDTFAPGAGLTPGTGVDFTGDLLTDPVPFNPANVADGLTPQINSAIDTSLLPNFTPPGAGPDMLPVPDVPTVPSFTPPGLDAVPPAPPPVPPGGGAPPPFDISTTPPEILNPTLQPPPNVDVPTPEIPGGPSWTDSITNALTKDPLRTAGTALGLGSLLRNRPNTVPSGLSNTVNNNGPIGDIARTTLTNNGAPTPDQMSVITATINQQRQQGTEAIIQASINSGQGGKDSMVVQDKIRAFNEQLAVMQIQLVQKQAEQNVMNALQELGMVTQEQFQLAQIELQQDTLAQNRAASIMQSLGWLWSGASSSKTPTTTPGGP